MRLLAASWSYGATHPAATQVYQHRILPFVAWRCKAWFLPLNEHLYPGEGMSIAVLITSWKVLLIERFRQRLGKAGRCAVWERPISRLMSRKAASADDVHYQGGRVYRKRSLQCPGSWQSFPPTASCPPTSARRSCWCGKTAAGTEPGPVQALQIPSIPSQSFHSFPNPSIPSPSRSTISRAQLTIQQEGFMPAAILAPLLKLKCRNKHRGMLMWPLLFDSSAV
jgi:hypothetical protein